MKKYKNFLPIEFYFLLAPSFFLFLYSIFYLNKFSINAFGVKEFLKVSFGASSPLDLPLLTLLLVLFFGVAVELFFSVKKIIIKDGQTTTKWKHVLSIFLIISLLAFVTYFLMMFTSLLFSLADPVKTADLSKTFLAWDKTIFKTHPGIWLINKFTGTFLEQIFLWVYNSLFLVFFIILLLSFFFSKNVFRRLVFSFFIAWIISFPIWFFFPVIPPDFMFRLDKLNMAGLEEKKSFNDFEPSTQLREKLEFYEKIHIIDLSSANRSLPISTFPSMHAAWGVIVAYSGIILWPWLGIFLVPWSILNGLGAVYVLEHYSVDIFLGIIIALISIIITERLFLFENKYFKDEFGLLSGFDYIRLVLRKFISDSGLLKFLKTLNYKIFKK